MFPGRQRLIQFLPMKLKVRFNFFKLETSVNLKKLIFEYEVFPKSFNVIVTVLQNIFIWMLKTRLKSENDSIFEKEDLRKVLEIWGIKKQEFSSLFVKQNTLISLCMDKNRRESGNVLDEKSLTIIERKLNIHLNLDIFCVLNFMFVEDGKFLRDYNVVLQKYDLIEKGLK
jgi:hypothetical protein